MPTFRIRYKSTHKSSLKKKLQGIPPHPKCIIPQESQIYELHTFFIVPDFPGVFGCSEETFKDDTLGKAGLTGVWSSGEESSGPKFKGADDNLSSRLLSEKFGGKIFINQTYIRC